MPKSNLTTLCYIEHEGKYLMMHRVKKEHDINKDKWVGIGGHFEPDESPEECLLREVREETGVTLTAYRFRGVITFVNDAWPTEYMYLFTSENFERTDTECREALEGEEESRHDQCSEEPECDEGDLVWIPKKDVYDLPIWEGDKIFFRLLEAGNDFFSLKLVYDERGTLLKAVLNGEEYPKDA